MLQPRREGAEEVDAANWIEVRELSGEARSALVELPVDLGESEAILLAATLGRPLLIDERRGRSVALARGVEVIGTLGVLMISKERELIDAVAPELDKLLDAEMHVSRQLIDEVLRQSAESKPGR